MERLGDAAALTASTLQREKIAFTTGKQAEYYALALVEAGQHREEGAGGEHSAQHQRDAADGTDTGGTPCKAEGGSSEEADEGCNREVVVFHSVSPFVILYYLLSVTITLYHAFNVLSSLMT